MNAPAPTPPFRHLGPETPVIPVLLSVPHSGRTYSPALLAASRLGTSDLAALEDPLVDRLVWRAVAAGAQAIVAEATRAEIDLNRDEREIDPLMIVPRPGGSDVLHSQRTRGGLGLIPSRIAGAGAIWHRPIAASELARRIGAVHRPYHAALAAGLKDIKSRFGIAILIDCHSMPAGGAGVDIVLGDRHATSMAPPLALLAEQAVRTAGYSVARNRPYAGGHVVTRHGAPRAGVHAMQVEIDRGLYLAPGGREAGPGFDRVALLLADLVGTLSHAASGGAEIAAE